jgi:hypothetical protein
VSRWPAIVATEFTVVLAGLLAAVVTLVLAFAIAEVARQLGAEDPWLPVLRWFGLPAVVLSQGLVFCRFWVTLAVAGVEEVAPPLAISRSRDLLRGKWLHVALLVATFGAAHVLSFLSFLFALTKADDAGHVAIAAWAFVLFDVLVLGPLAAIAAAVTYFAARARESGASIGAAAAAAHPP